METKVTKKRICPFCGKTIEYEHISDDGYDWEGHHRGSGKEYDTPNKCDCEMRPFKKMCLNCAFNSNGECTSEKITKLLKEKINNQTPFTVREISTQIKDETKKCDYWELSTNIITKYFE